MFSSSRKGSGLAVPFLHQGVGMPKVFFANFNAHISLPAVDLSSLVAHNQ